MSTGDHKQPSEIIEEAIFNRVVFDKPIQFGEWQLCPKCLGEGTIFTIGTTTDCTRLCDVCNGAKILAKPIIK